MADRDDYALVSATVATVAARDLPYRPPVPARPHRIALIGAGGISFADLDANGHEAGSDEHGAMRIKRYLPFDEWIENVGTIRLTGALLDRLTHHVAIFETKGGSYRLGQSRAQKADVSV